MVNTKTLVNIKYNTEIKKAGEELKVNVEDINEMIKRGYIELLEDLPEEDNSPEDNEEDNEGE